MQNLSEDDSKLRNALLSKAYTWCKWLYRFRIIICEPQFTDIVHN